MSLFITFEGGEGSGKSYQTRLLYQKLKEINIPVLLTQEPGGTSIGEHINRQIKWSQQHDISPLSELLLFNASRSQLVSKVIKPALEVGEVVLCDRFSDSTIAYQGYGRGLDLNTVKAVNDLATQGLKPDLTIFLEVPSAQGLSRKSANRRDRFEQEDIDFHHRVLKGYHKLAVAEPSRWLVVDGTRSKEEVAHDIWGHINRLLSERQG